MIKILVQGINFLFGNYLKKKKYFFGKSLEFLSRKRVIDRNYLDYIRLSTLELASHEINNKKIPGNVAELGVYRGKFARYINGYFPDRILYLFDTFEGFDSRDKIVDIKNDFSSGEQDFSNTSVEKVMSLMPYPQQCKVMKGFFPESAENLVDTFAFVSIDTDLYEPIYNGLCYFFPKMAAGGFIFVHDFNNESYKGTRNAVENFCREYNARYVPIPDSGGSVIIPK